MCLVDVSPDVRRTNPGIAETAGEAMWGTRTRAIVDNGLAERR